MKKIVFTFGRFNPPTIGHKLLVDKVKKEAKKLKADYKIFASPSWDKKKNPLSFKDKLKIMRKVLRNIHLGADSTVRNPFHALKQLSDEGYEDVTMVVGSDRVAEFKKSVPKYVGADKDFKFSKFKVVSAGERDPDAEGVQGMSASKMRNAATNGNLDAFRLGLPKNISEKDAKTIFRTLQKSMGIKPHITESWFNYEEFAEFAEKYEQTILLGEGENLYKAKIKRWKDKSRQLSQHWRERVRMRVQQQKDRMRAYEKDVESGQTASESADLENDNLNEISMQSRRKMARAAKRTSKKRARVRKIKKKRRKSTGEIKKKSQKAARNFFRKKILKSMKWENVPIKQRETIEKVLNKKKAAITKLSKRLIPKMQKAEQKRLKQVRAKMTSNNPKTAQESMDVQFENLILEGTANRAMKNDKEMAKGTGASTPKERDAARKRAERDDDTDKKNNRPWEKSGNPWDHTIFILDDRDDAYKLEMADDLDVEHHTIVFGPSISPDIKSKGKVTLTKVMNYINRGENFIETKTSKKLLKHTEDMKKETEKALPPEEQAGEEMATPEEEQAALEQQAQEEFEKEYFVGEGNTKIPRSLDKKSLTELRKEGLGRVRNYEEVELPQARINVPKDEGKQLEYAFTYVALHRSGLSDDDIEARFQYTPELTAFNADSLGRAKAIIKSLEESGFDPAQLAGAAYSGEMNISGIKGGEPKTDNVILLEEDDPMNEWAFTKGMLGVSMKKDGDIQASSAQGPRASSDIQMGITDAIESGKFSKKMSKGLEKVLRDLANMPSKIISPKNIDKALSSDKNYTDKKKVGDIKYLKPEVKKLFVDGDPNKGIRDEVNGELWTQQLGKDISKRLDEEFKTNPEMSARVLYEQLSGQKTFSQEGTDSRAAADVMMTPYGMHRITLDYCKKLIETGAISIRVSQKGSGGGLGRMTLRVDVKGQIAGSPAIKNVANFLTSVGINECVGAMKRFLVEAANRDTGIADVDSVRKDLPDYIGDIASSLFMKNYDISIEGDLFKPFEEEGITGKEFNVITIGKKAFKIPVTKTKDDVLYQKGEAGSSSSTEVPEKEITPESSGGHIKESRNYRNEYDKYQGKPKQRANRSKRVLARRKLISLGRASKGDGKDVDHKDGNPQNNSERNLRIRNRSLNRSDNKQKLYDEHGAGEWGTKELLKKYIKDTPKCKIYNLDNEKK